MADTNISIVERENIDYAKEIIVLGIDKDILFNLITLNEYNKAVVELEQERYANQ